MNDIITYNTIKHLRERIQDLQDKPVIPIGYHHRKLKSINTIGDLFTVCRHYCVIGITYLFSPSHNINIDRIIKNISDGKLSTEIEMANYRGDGEHTINKWFGYFVVYDSDIEYVQPRWLDYLEINNVYFKEIMEHIKQVVYQTRRNMEQMDMSFIKKYLNSILEKAILNIRKDWKKQFTKKFRVVNVVLKKEYHWFKIFRQPRRIVMEFIIYK